jgi:putative ABC transport system ATP-binding protein
MPLAYSDRGPAVDAAAKPAGLVAELRDISVVYGADAASVHAVRGVSLEIRRGEVLLLMGPSGSGKSTLLQVLGCIRYATSGSVFIDGKSVAGLSENDLSRIRRRRMGFVFQHYNLLPSLRAWENVALALELGGMSGSGLEVTSRRILAHLGLERRSNAYPEELSGGEKQRVAIARAVVANPDIVLADEPTAALDAASGAQVAQLLANIAHEDGRAVVIVTHDPRIVGIGDRVVSFEDGKIRSIAMNVHAQSRALQENVTYEVEDRNRDSAAGGSDRRAVRIA